MITEEQLNTLRLRAFSLLLQETELVLKAHMNQALVEEERIVSHRLLEKAETYTKQLQIKIGKLKGAMYLVRKEREKVLIEYSK